MNLPDIVFTGIVAITLLGGVLAVWPKNVFYNAMALILCLFGVAGLFIFLNSEFLAVVEVIIYIGAISVAIIFAIMLSRPWAYQHNPRNKAKVFRAGFASVILFLALMKVLNHTSWPVTVVEGDYSMQLIGKALLTEYALPFEIVSLVLLVAIIGALVISADKEKAE